MSDLQMALFGLGGVFLLGLVIWEWRRSRRRHAQSDDIVTPVAANPGEEWSRRIEPRIDSLTSSRREAPLQDFTAIDDVPPMHANAPVSVPVMRETAVDTPGAARVDVPMSTAPLQSSASAPAPEDAGNGDTAPLHDDAAALDVDSETGIPSTPILWPPQNAERVLTLRIVGRNGDPLPGRAARLALEQAGLVFGPQRIFHRVDAHGAVLASAANMVRPGDLDPATLDELQLRGLSLFSVLPGPFPASRMLDELIMLARSLASRLHAQVHDEHGQELDAGRLQALRQSLAPAQDRH